MADGLKNRRAVLKATGALGTIAALAVPVVILPKEAEAAALINSPVPALWARWRAIKPEYTRITAEAEAARNRYLAAEPALPREAYAGPQHFGLGVIFFDSTPSGQLMRWGMASHWRSVASACDGDEHSQWVRDDALQRAAVMDRWDAECGALRDSSGVTSIGDRLAAIEDELDALEQQIFAEPIRTLNDASIQATILREYLHPGGWHLVGAFLSRLEQVGGAHG